MPPKLARLPPLLFPLLIVGHVGAAEPLALRQRPGARLPLDAIVIDETGRPLKLGLLLGGRPALLLPGYFHCRKLCDPLRHNVMDLLENSGLLAGRDYTLLAMSFDERETSEDSARAKAESLEFFRFPGTGEGWRFLTAARINSRLIADAIGFDYAQSQNQGISHPAGVVVVTPGGVVSRYLPGFGLEASFLRMAVTKAAAGGIAPPAGPMTLICFNVDPVTGRASFSLLKTLRLLTFGFVVAGVFLVGRTILHERRI